MTSPDSYIISDFLTQYVEQPILSFKYEAVPKISGICVKASAEPFEWDVQLSTLGKKHYNDYRNGKDHLNVLLKGRITHA